MKPSLSVVIPAYNEEENVAICLKNVSDVLKKIKIDSEIILVNDGSKDKTGEIAKSFIGKIPHLKVVENRPNRGYGGSLQAGFAASAKEFIVFVPADNQFDFSEVTKFLEKQKETNADIVSGIRVHDSDPLHRKINRWGWNTIVRALFGYLASDVDCGFKLIRRSILEKVNLSSRGALIDTQLFAGARARGYQIAEIPVTHLPRTAGQSTGANPKVILKAFRELFTFWWQLKQEIMTEQGKTVFPWEILLIILILLVAGFFRLYKIDQYMTFLGDEGRDVIVVRDMLLGHKFTLIGPGTSIGSMYLGPLYYYLMLLPLWLANFSPVGPAVQIAIFGIATGGLVWWIGRQWFGRAAALMMAFLYAISPVVIIYSRSSWNPNIMPFFALLAMYSIWKVWRFGYWRWLVLCAVSLAFVLNSHYLGLLLIPPVGLYWLLSGKNPSRTKYSLISLFVFLLLLSPLFLFDLRHNWTNTHALSQFFSVRQSTVNLKPYKAIPNLLPLWTDIVTTLLAGKDKVVGQILAIVMVAGVALVAYFRKGKQNFRDFIFILVWITSGLIGLGLYKQHIYDHYFGFLFPALFLLLGFIIQVLSSHRLIRLATGIALLVLFSVNLSHNPFLSTPNQQMQRTREISNFIVTESQGEPFNLALISKTNYDAAYRYFLSLDNAPYFTIHQKLSDQLFVICEDTVCQPIGHPLWEIASFGWAKVDKEWEFPWGTKLFRLVHNPSGK
jgi:glycosyltransferase involved in cell wall biosynthesis